MNSEASRTYGMSSSFGITDAFRLRNKLYKLILIFNIIMALSYENVVSLHKEYSSRINLDDRYNKRVAIYMFLFLFGFVLTSLAFVFIWILPFLVILILLFLILMFVNAYKTIKVRLCL